MLVDLVHQLTAVPDRRDAGRLWVLVTASPVMKYVVRDKTSNSSPARRPSAGRATRHANSLQALSDVLDFWFVEMIASGPLLAHLNR